MKILFQIPSLHTLYAGRTIYFGYKHAFEELGHSFRPLTADDNPEALLSYQPDILITSLNSYCLRYLPAAVVAAYKKRGGKVFVNIAFWQSPMSKLRVGEAPSISQNNEYISLIRSGVYGDVFYNICEQGDPRMEGFEKTTGYRHVTILLAADKTILFPEYSKKFQADISYIGSFLPEKRNFIKEYVSPLKNRYKVKLYGQDWTVIDRSLGMIQKGGQYFNLPLLRSLRKPKLALEDERRIYASSLISLNIHEAYQKKFGGDCNERSFKIPLSGGFEITDDVACIRKYFKTGKEIIIAENKDDWFEKIEYYIKNPEKRLPIIEAGKKKVATEHTYHNRVKQMLEIYSRIK